MKAKSTVLSIILALTATVYAGINQNAEAQEPERKPIEVVAYEIEVPEPAPVETIEIVETVPEPEYFDVPLSHDLQAHIFEECEKHSIAPAIVIAVIERESRYDSQAIGDDGCSIGLMQIQEKWHRERMDKLGCTDLLDPYQNITVGVDYLAELFQKDLEVYWVLMAYNGGPSYANKKLASGNYSTYAIEVAERAAELEGGEY